MAAALKLPVVPTDFESWKQAGAAFLKIKVSTDGVLRRDYLNLQDAIKGEDGDIKSLLISIGKWIHAGTVNDNLGKILSQSFTRMLELYAENPLVDPSVNISSSQLLALSVELEERLVKTLNESDWEALGYTDIMHRVFGDSVGGIKPFKLSEQEKRQKSAKKKIISHTKILHTLESKLQQKCIEYSKSVDFFSSDYNAIEKALRSLEESVQEVEERTESLETERVAAQHGYGFTVESVRDTILAPVANTTQCESVIGKYKPTDICYLCGLPFNIGVEKGNPQVDCEHVLGVLLAGLYINLVQGGSRIFSKEDANYREILKLEYLWAHHCCNIIKSDEPFIQKEKQQNGSYKYVVHERKINEMIHDIISKANDKNEKLGCRKLMVFEKKKKGSDRDRVTVITQNKQKIVKHMQLICDFINGQIEGIKAIVGPEEGVNPDLMASQIFEAFIKFRFFGRIQDSLIIKALINAATIFNYKTGLLSTVWPKIGESNGESNQQGERSQGGRQYKRKQYGGANEYKNDIFDMSLIMFLNIFTKEEFSYIIKASKFIFDLPEYTGDKNIAITNLFLYMLRKNRIETSHLLDNLKKSRIIAELRRISPTEILSDDDITSARSRRMSGINMTYDEMAIKMKDVINPKNNNSEKTNNNINVNMLNTFLVNSYKSSVNALFISIQKALSLIYSSTKYSKTVVNRQRIEAEAKEKLYRLKEVEREIIIQRAQQAREITMQQGIETQNNSFNIAGISHLHENNDVSQYTENVASQYTENSQSSSPIRRLLAQNSQSLPPSSPVFQSFSSIPSSPASQSFLPSSPITKRTQKFIESPQSNSQGSRSSTPPISSPVLSRTPSPAAKRRRPAEIATPQQGNQLSYGGYMSKRRSTCRMYHCKRITKNKRSIHKRSTQKRNKKNKQTRRRHK